ncbi:hypothetical protein GCM10022226_57250 [Sphaerisporangium flaviroseum]|uniref:STAS domain-containing protein n=1 Tax=Sphaerisporangium flaviroseum TaxID=509199 RepID=A0ABP7IXN6_9ACTN
MNADITPSAPHDQVVDPFTIFCRQLSIAKMVDPLGLRIEGELDARTLPFLTWALGTVTGDGDVSLDLAAVRFIDVGCLRALVTTAARLQEGHVLTLWSASPQLRRLLELTGWHETPQLRLRNVPLPALEIAPLRRLVQMLGLRLPPSLA